MMMMVSTLLFIVNISALVFVAHAQNMDERYTVRNRRARVRNSATNNGKVRRGNNKNVDDEEIATNTSSFSQEQLNAYRRLGITCGNENGDYGKQGSTGKDGGYYGKDGGTGKDGGYYGKDGSKEGGDSYDKEGSKEGNQGSRRRKRRNRRLAMRAFTYHRAGECICDEELGICWIWGDQHDDPICCQPEGVDHFPVAAPVQSPVAPPASLSPPLDERTWSNDMPTFIPAGF